MGRWSTITGSFAAALVLFDAYDEAAARAAIADLGQDPDGDLQCVYCGEAAATWDHIEPKVKNRRPTGHGHHIRNLVPSCRHCNETKSGNGWRTHIAKVAPDAMKTRIARIEKFLGTGGVAPVSQKEFEAVGGKKLTRFYAILDEVESLLREADLLADDIRSRLQAARSSVPAA